MIMVVVIYVESDHSDSDGCIGDDGVDEDGFGDDSNDFYY